MTEQVKVIGRWVGHLLALAVLLVFLAAAEDSCASEEESPAPTTATKDEAALTEDEAATAAAKVVEEGRAMFDATATAEAEEEKPARELAELDAKIEYLDEAGLLNDEGMENIDGFLDWMDDVAFEYELGVMFPDTAAGQLAMDRMRDVVRRIESLNPPPAFQESYDLMLAAYRELVMGMELCVAGADQADPGLVNQGTAHVNEATRLMGLATDALERAE